MDCVLYILTINRATLDFVGYMMTIIMASMDVVRYRMTNIRDSMNCVWNGMAIGGTALTLFGTK